MGVAEAVGKAIIDTSLKEKQGNVVVDKVVVAVGKVMVGEVVKLVVVAVVDAVVEAIYKVLFEAVVVVKLVIEAVVEVVRIGAVYLRDFAHRSNGLVEVLR